MRKLNTSKNFQLVFLVSLAIEIVIQFLSLGIPTFLIIFSFYTKNYLFFLVSLLLSLYIYPLSILIFSGIFIRLLPKPALGKLEYKQDYIRHILIISIEYLIKRTSAKYLMNMLPFPGIIFTKIVGSKIDVSTVISPGVEIYDYARIEIGPGSLIGEGAFLSGHYQPGIEEFFIGKVKIGKKVMIGRNAIIWPDVVIGNNSIIQDNSNVVPGTRIGNEQVWGGNPAKLITTKSKDNIKLETSINDLSLNVVNADDSEVIITLKKIFLLVSGNNISNYDESIYGSGLVSSIVLLSFIDEVEKEFKINFDRNKLDIFSLSLNDLVKLIKS